MNTDPIIRFYLINHSTAKSVQSQIEDMLRRNNILHLSSVNEFLVIVWRPTGK
jgi:hypothetical protein